MKEREGEHDLSWLWYFLIGSGIGAVVAVLFAPRSGRETRELIAQRASESRDRVLSASRNVSDRVSTYIDKGKEVVSAQKEQISAAMGAGKQAYGDETYREAAVSDTHPPPPPPTRPPPVSR